MVWYWREKVEGVWEKTVPVTLVRHKTDTYRVKAVGSRRLTWDKVTNQSAQHTYLLLPPTAQQPRHETWDNPYSNPKNAFHVQCYIYSLCPWTNTKTLLDKYDKSSSTFTSQTFTTVTNKSFLKTLAYSSTSYSLGAHKHNACLLKEYVTFFGGWKRCGDFKH